MKHSVSVLVWYLRVNGLKIKWWIDLPELKCIRIGSDAFQFYVFDKSTELIMRSGYDELKWWIDLPKLTSLTTEGYSDTFCNPRYITLEGITCLSILTSRHALSHWCCSSQEICLQAHQGCPYEECLFFLSFTPRHPSRYAELPLIVFHARFFTSMLLFSIWLLYGLHHDVCCKWVSLWGLDVGIAFDCALWVMSRP